MKTIKELEAEIGKVVMNIENCDAAECNHKGWDALLDKLEAEKKTLKDVLGLIDELDEGLDSDEFRILKARING